MDAPWRIELLGWLRATQRERVVSRFRAHKMGALLAYLAYHCHRERVQRLTEVVGRQMVKAVSKRKS